MSSLDVEAVESAKESSTFQVLFRTARMVNEAALERVRRSTGIALKPSHTNLFPHIDFEGTRITVLAKRLGISKQAVSQLVAELEAAGGVERVPDPSDGRARLVRFKPGMLLDGLAELRAFEDELAAVIGTEKMDTLRGILNEVAGTVSESTREDT